MVITIRIAWSEEVVMKKLTRQSLAVAAFVAGASQFVSADVIEAAPDRYVLKAEATSSLAPAEVWARLIKPAKWWHPDHTYSGSAANLSLDPQAGGLWREDWDGGSVQHGSVLLVQDGQKLRLDAPFGPLQDIGAKTTWTITLEPDGEGTKVTFDEIAYGSEASKLDMLAPAVDFVKTEAIRRLTATEQPNP